MTEESPCDLTACVIGRNSANQIERIGMSLQALKGCGLNVELVYVDSASTDGSADLAETWFDRVLVLESNENLCASAGRFVGTEQARGRWILYLDSDMTLEAPFLPRLSEYVRGDTLDSGVVGRCVDVFEDGRERLMRIKGNRHNEICRLFGGAVVLLRRAVVAAGNWNPRFFSNEEAELYARMRERGDVVRFADIPFVRHYTVYVPPRHKLLHLFLPLRRGLGNKYFGPGQIVSSHIQAGTLFAFVRRFPYPFALIFGVILAAAAAPFYPALALALFAASIGYVAVTCGWRLNAVYLAWIPQIVYGVAHFDRTFVPKVARDWSFGTPGTSAPQRKHYEREYSSRDG